MQCCAKWRALIHTTDAATSRTPKHTSQPSCLPAASILVSVAADRPDERKEEEALNPGGLLGLT